jgi:gliding motility associated protien GldN
MKFTTIILFISFAIPSILEAQCCEEMTILELDGGGVDTFKRQVFNEADIVWSKRVWRIIDMRESSNRMLLNPRISKEINLMNFLSNSIFSLYINAYSNDDFRQKMSSVEIKKAFTKYDSSNVGGELKVDSSFLNTNTIKRFLIKEDYYFNKRNSRMEVKILGLAPLIDEFDSAGAYLGEKQLCWLYYPLMRCCLNKHKVRLNNDSIVTLESFITNHMFTSEIYYVSTVHQENLPRKRERNSNQQEMDYERKRIRNEENDLWEY